MGKNYSDISGTSKKEFTFKNQKVSVVTGRQTIVNNQITPANITDMVIDKTKNSAFQAILSIDRNVSASGISGVQNNGNGKKVTSCLYVIGVNGYVVTGDFTGGAYVVGNDGTILSSFIIGSGFNDTVNGVINTGSGLLFFGKFTTYKGNTRNRVCFTDYNGNDDFASYDTFGLNAGSGATGFNGEVTCASNADMSYWFFAGNDIELNGVGNLRGIWQVDKVASSVAVGYSSMFTYGTPVFLMWNAPYGGGFYIGGVSISDSTNPERHIVALGYTSADVCDFDGAVLCGEVSTDNNYYWFGGEFDTVNATSCPKLVMTNAAATNSGTQLIKDAGYTSGFAATSGNKINEIYSLLDITSTFGVCIVGGKFNDFTSQNIVSIDNVGAEYTTYSGSYGTGLPAAIASFSINGITTDLNTDVFGGDYIAATDTFTYKYVTSTRFSQFRTMYGNYSAGSGNMSLAVDSFSGDSGGVVISFDAPTGQFKYTSSYLPTNVSELRFKLELL